MTDDKTKHVTLVVGAAAVAAGALYLYKTRGRGYNKLNIVSPPPSDIDIAQSVKVRVSRVERVRGARVIGSPPHTVRRALVVARPCHRATCGVANTPPACS
eukprot:1807373-Prymnesium_polylepis.3